MSGATLSDDGETMTGSCFIIAAESRAEAEAFSNNDPFTEAGVFSSVTVTRMKKSTFIPENYETSNLFIFGVSRFQRDLLWFDMVSSGKDLSA